MANKFKPMATATQTKQLNSIRSRGLELREDAIALANGFLMHYVGKGQGDMDNAMAIADTLGEVYTKGVRKAFIDWCTTFADSLTWDEDDKCIRHVKGRGLKLNTFTDAEGNERHHYEVPFFEFVVENVRPFDVIKSIETAVKRGRAVLENDKPHENFDEKKLTKIVNALVKTGYFDSEVTNTDQKQVIKASETVKEV
jgi:hypothetical protein